MLVSEGTPPPEWTCHDVACREYEQLEGQVREVRLTGEISTPALMAAREAALEAIRAAGQPQPEALVVYGTMGDGAGSAIFGTNECRSGLSVEF